MDYGQLAYIKAEELERYVKSVSVRKKRNAVSASFYPRVAAESGYEPCSVSGEGSIGVAVSAALRSPQSVRQAKLRLYCGGKIAASAGVAQSGGATVSYTLFASVTPGAGETLRLEADTAGLVLEELRVLVFGDGASVDNRGGNLRAEWVGTETYLAREKQGAISLSVYGGGEITVARGQTFDICDSPDGPGMVISDDAGNLWGVAFDAEINETARVNLGAGVDSVALGRNRRGYIIAGVRGRRVYFCECGYDFSGRTDWTEADFTTEADKVYFTKHTEEPILFLSRDGALYAKIPVRSLVCVSAVGIKPRLTIL